MSRRLRSRAVSLAVSALATLLLALPAAAQKRVALIIGNAAYVHAGALANPANDAGDMAAALRQMNFEVILGLDLDKKAFDAKVRDFSRALADAETGILFYAGHGLQVAGRNYLVPVDAQLASERDLDFEAVGLEFILKQMELEREGKTNIVFLDACRDNPLARNLARSMGTRSASIGRGLAQVQTGVGTFIAYSTQPGNVALDGQGRNSPFTAALVKSVRQPGRNLTAVMIDVRKEVLSATGGKQVPWDHSALTGDFYFHLASAPGVLPRIGAPEANAETEAMQQRLKQLEDELKRKSDPQQTANIVLLAQLKERLRQLDQANRADQQRLFDTYRKHGPASDPAARNALNREVGDIQLQMARRGQEQKALKEQITKLEADAGLAPQARARRRSSVGCTITRKCRSTQRGWRRGGCPPRPGARRRSSVAAHGASGPARQPQRQHILPLAMGQNTTLRLGRRRTFAAGLSFCVSRRGGMRHDRVQNDAGDLFDHARRAHRGVRVGRIFRAFAGAGRCCPRRATDQRGAADQPGPGENALRRRRPRVRARGQESRAEDARRNDRRAQVLYGQEQRLGDCHGQGRACCAQPHAGQEGTGRPEGEREEGAAGRGLPVAVEFFQELGCARRRRPAHASTCMDIAQSLKYPLMPSVLGSRLHAEVMSST